MRAARGFLLACAGLAATVALAQNATTNPTATTAAASAPAPHVVQPGETLWGLSGQYLQTPQRWPEVQQRNQVGDPRLLQPGKLLYFVDGRLVAPGASAGASTAASPNATTSATTSAAVVAAVEGQAWRRRPGSAEQPLGPGMPVLPGDVLVTGGDAFVTLGLPGGSRAVLPSRSTLEVQAVDARTVRLRLIEGRVESQVHKQQPGQQFEIRARTMGLGVRGTHFRVRDEDGLLTGEVIEGEVVVSKDTTARQQLVLRAGDGAVLLDNGTAQAQALLPAPQLAPQTGPRRDRTLRVVPVPGAQAYRLQLARDELFLLPLHEQRGPATAFDLPPGLPAGLYPLRLTAFDAHGLEGLPGDSTVYLPASATSAPGTGTATPLPDGRVEIRWPGEPGRRYSFELSRSADFSLRLVEVPAVYATGMMVGPFAEGARGGRFHWRVREAEGTGTPAPPVPPAQPTPNAAPAFGGSFDLPAR